MCGPSSASDDSGRRSYEFWLPRLTYLLGKLRIEYFIIVVTGALMSAADGLIHPLLVRAIFDGVVSKQGITRLSLLVIEYLILGLFVSLGSAGVSLWSKSLENRIVLSVSSRLLDSYYRADYGAVLKNGQGYFVARIHGDVRDGLIPLLLLIQTTASAGVLLLSLSAVLVYLSWQAFLCLVFLIPTFAFVGAFVGRRIKMLTTAERERDGAVLAILSKALSSFRIINCFQLEQKTVHVFSRRLESYLSTSYQRYKVTRRFQAVNDLTMVISDFLSLFVGGIYVLRGALSFGSYLAFVNAFWRAATTLLQIVKSIPDFHAYGVIMTRIVDFVSQAAGQTQRLGNALAIHNLKFSYGDATILRDVSLRLSPGEKVVVAGPNGCGKTTLANILAGYLAPAEGEVTLPAKVSAVTLPIIFPPLRVKDLVKDADLLAAFKLTGPDILEAYADELSVGQQQKLAICLALSRKADLYVIDEPLANLDKESRDHAINLILARTTGKNLILIMHDAEKYYGLFDRVMIMDLPGTVPSLPRNGSDQSQLIALHA